jgi:hypothetical protein
MIKLMMEAMEVEWIHSPNKMEEEMLSIIMGKRITRLIMCSN